MAAYEGRFGLYASHLGPLAQACDLSLATADLGRVWEVTQVAVKPLPACHFTHAFADAAVALRAQHGIEPAQIAAIRALVPAEVIKTVCEPVENKKKPQNSYDAQFSVHYAVASGLVRGRFGLAELEPEALSDPTMLGIASKVSYEIDPKSAFPTYYSGEVVVTLADGREVRHREHVNRGASDRPLTSDEITTKFMENATMALSEEAAIKVLGAIHKLDTMPAAELSAVLAGRAS
ncbi:hypothetical protein QBK99_20060 [Corticibacterium sp. UT-5YL-CI-8]|nr:hypothetical protein [Tianweitania sp. UT-5YL-CI-8]